MEELCLWLLGGFAVFGAGVALGVIFGKTLQTDVQKVQVDAQAISAGVLTELQALEAAGKLDAHHILDYVDAHIAVLRAKAKSLAAAL